VNKEAQQTDEQQQCPASLHHIEERLSHGCNCEMSPVSIQTAAFVLQANAEI
jgi:hypothetical protein